MNEMKENEIVDKIENGVVEIIKVISEVETSPCKHMAGEICINERCPLYCDVCRVQDIEGVCRFEERNTEIDELFRGAEIG